MVEPWRTRLEEIRSGDNKLSLQSGKPGGLIGLRTVLSPSLFADDRLAGCVVGRLGTLPPVYEVLHLSECANVVDASHNIGVCDESESELKEGDEVRVHAGSSSVYGSVVKVREHGSVLDVELCMPICAALRSLVAIEKKQSQTFRLAAHARVCGGRECELLGASASVAENFDEMEGGLGHDPSTSVEHTCVDAHGRHCSDEYWRDCFLHAYTAQARQQHEAKIELPFVTLEREGSTKLARSYIWTNFSETLKAIDRPVGHFLKYFIDANLEASLAGAGEPVVRFKWKEKQDLLDDTIYKLRGKYVKEFVACQDEKCDGWVALQTIALT